jgi:hypothetical protein
VEQMRLQLLKLLYRWIYRREARLILMGYRPEVVCFVQDIADSDRFLLIRPPVKPLLWVPPQEGIKLDESIETAVERCLQVELGLCTSQFQFRRSVWIGTRRLPSARWGERDLHYSLRSWIGKPAMVGKGYFGALVLADASIPLRPNPVEVLEYGWLDVATFWLRISTNCPNKYALLCQAWRKLSLIDMDAPKLPSYGSHQSAGQLTE